MTDKPTKKPLAYLENESGLHVLMHRLKEIEQLNANVNKHLDAALKPYCKATSLANGKLTLVAANSSIASQIHFQSADLLRKFKQDAALKAVQTIQCKVQVQSPRLQHTHTKQQKVNLPSEQTALLIQDIANSIEDPKLKQAMQQLADSALSPDKNKK
jgi:hypothetical protein